MYRLDRPAINGKTSVWYVVWTEGRRSRRRSTGTTDKRQADTFLAEWTAIQSAPPTTFVCRDLSAAYLAEASERVKYPKSIAQCLKNIDAHFGDLPPTLVSKATVRLYHAKRKREGVGISTVTKELLFFRQAMKFGVKEGWMKKDDEPDIQTPGVNPGRQRFLTGPEFAAIFHAASPLHLRTFLALAIDTLARGKAILALRWDRIDFDAGIVWYRPHDDGSNKRSVAVPMSDRLRTQLTQARQAALTPWVIEWNGDRVLSVRTAYETATARAGVVDAHRHDLRRTGASWLVQDGYSFDRVGDLLGDSPEIVRKHYGVFAPGHLREMVGAIGKARA